MNISKLLDTAAELEAEAARCIEAAQDIRDIVKRLSNGAAAQPLITPRVNRVPQQPPVATAQQTDTTSALVLAFQLLQQAQKPVHVNEMVPLIAQKRPGFATSRSTIESALVRGMQGRYKNLIRRTGPGTFAASQQ